MPWHGGLSFFRSLAPEKQARLLLPNRQQSELLHDEWELRFLHRVELLRRFEF